MRYWNRRAWERTASQVAALLKLQGKRKVKVEGVEGLNSSNLTSRFAKDGNGNRYFTSSRGGTYPSKMPGIRIDRRNKIFSEEKQDYTDREYFSVYRQDGDGNVSEVVSNVLTPIIFRIRATPVEQGLLFYSVTRGITR
ncbi:hypothetical protein V8V91_17760 [Algoriphagus halophilus]|uniref:hypothetical protein n=1 Tax=Algoriphagus halophilus TaxID=226505 RepID=UPI00358E7C1E